MRSRRPVHVHAAALGRIAVLLCLVLFMTCISRPVRAEAAADPRGPQGTITFDFGDGRTYQVTPDLALTMCQTGPDGQYVTDPATGRFAVDPWRVLSFLQGLQRTYTRSGATTGTYFQATRGDLIPLSGGSSARYTFDLNTELPYLYAALVGSRTETHKVNYPGLPAGGANVSLAYNGTTYIEIDLTLQTLYYYVGGNLALATPIVTGNVSAGMGTPTVIYYVNNKATGTYLVGRNYRSYVNYWMPIIRNSIGIHDATWRSSFGGQIYRTSGSHGCINVPLANMQQLYPITNVGTPVIIFY